MVCSSTNRSEAVVEILLIVLVVGGLFSDTHNSPGAALIIAVHASVEQCVEPHVHKSSTSTIIQQHI